jgi:hypothetical protein
VTAQVALSFLLLFGAGLFVKSLQNLKTTETGVSLENLVSFQLSPALSGYDNERAQAFYTTLLERLRSAPGVVTAGLASVPILAGDEWDSSMSVEGPQGRGRRGHAGVHERRISRLFRHDEDTAHRRARLPRQRCQEHRRQRVAGDPVRRDREP